MPRRCETNSATAAPLYGRLLPPTDDAAGGDPAGRLARRLRALADRAGLPDRLRTEGVDPDDLPRLADDASRQWTATFNPRPLTATDTLELYRCAF